MEQTTAPGAVSSHQVLNHSPAPLVDLTGRLLHLQFLGKRSIHGRDPHLLPLNELVDRCLLGGQIIYIIGFPEVQRKMQTKIMSFFKPSSEEKPRNISPPSDELACDPVWQEKQTQFTSITPGERLQKIEGMMNRVTKPRKAVTLLLSYLLFTKPMTEQHGTGLILILMGIILKMLPENKPQKRPVTLLPHLNSKARVSTESRQEMDDDDDDEEQGTKRFELGNEDDAQEKRPLV